VSRQFGQLDTIIGRLRGESSEENVEYFNFDKSLVLPMYLIFCTQ